MTIELSINQLAIDLASRKVPLAAKQVKQHAERHGLDSAAVLSAVRALRSRPVSGVELEEQRTRSAAGASRYYSRGRELARVSDHAPTAATQAWIDANAVLEIGSAEECV